MAKKIIKMPWSPQSTNWRYNSGPTRKTSTRKCYRKSERSLRKRDLRDFARLRHEATFFGGPSLHPSTNSPYGALPPRRGLLL